MDSRRRLSSHALNGVSVSKLELINLLFRMYTGADTTGGSYVGRESMAQHKFPRWQHGISLSTRYLALDGGAKG